jgi:hypothetical protein
VIDLQKYGRDLLVMAVIAVFLTFINPYQATGGMIFPLALLYWFAMIFIGGSFAEIGMWVHKRLLPNAPNWGQIVVAAFVSALAVTAFIIITETLFNQGIPITYWLSVYGLVFVISVAITLISFLTKRAFDTPAAADTNSDPTQTFLQRLPVKFHSASLHAIASEDHYLRVYTSLGDDLILMRLADAERELQGADGARVHRSWWIAKAGVTDEKKQDSRSLLILPNGTEVPVSRSYRAKAKEAGLIA